MKARWLLVVALGSACQEPQPFAAAMPLEVPANLAEHLPEPAHNPMTAAGVELGRRLFFDPLLSGSEDLSCASCHRPELAFSDGERLSIGASGRRLARHTPALANLAWAPGYFWDGGAKNLESQAFAPLTSPDEMDRDLDALLDDLRLDPTYPGMFARAFDDGLTLANLARALAQFERTLVFADSRYDRFVRGEPDGDLDAREREGLAAFERHCATCHVPDFFTDHGFHNNGLDDTFSEDDERIAWGRARITHHPADIGKFKTPTLRNVTLTAPYMHDGRLATLEDVLAHYRHGVRLSSTLAPELVAADGTPGIPMTDAEADALIAFLGALEEGSP